MSHRRRVLHWQVPPGAAFFENSPVQGPNVRVDSGVVQGDLVRIRLRVVPGVDVVNRSMLACICCWEIPAHFLERDSRSEQEYATMLPALQVGTLYDPMVAKLVASGPDRAAALARLHTALGQLQVRRFRVGGPAAADHHMLSLLSWLLAPWHGTSTSMTT